MAACSKCGAKDPDCYPGDKRCKACARAAVRANRAANLSHYQAFDRGRAMIPKRVAARKAYAKTEAGKVARSITNRNYWSANKEKRRATVAVGNAVRDGRLVKQPCEVCGATKVEAHHDDYSKPLEVRWRCNKHHREIHKRKT